MIFRWIAWALIGCFSNCLSCVSGETMKFEYGVNAPTKVDYGDYEGSVGVILRMDAGDCLVRMLHNGGHRDVMIPLANLKHPKRLNRV